MSFFADWRCSWSIFYFLYCIETCPVQLLLEMIKVRMITTIICKDKSCNKCTFCNNNLNSKDWKHEANVTGYFIWYFLAPNGYATINIERMACNVISCRIKGEKSAHSGYLFRLSKPLQWNWCRHFFLPLLITCVSKDKDRVRPYSESWALSVFGSIPGKTEKMIPYQIFCWKCFGHIWVYEPRANSIHCDASAGKLFCSALCKAQDTPFRCTIVCLPWIANLSSNWGHVDNPTSSCLRCNLCRVTLSQMADKKTWKRRK